MGDRYRPWLLIASCHSAKTNLVHRAIVVGSKVTFDIPHRARMRSTTAPSFQWSGQLDDETIVAVAGPDALVLRTRSSATRGKTHTSDYQRAEGDRSRSCSCSHPRDAPTPVNSEERSRRPRDLARVDGRLPVRSPYSRPSRDRLNRAEGAHLSTDGRDRCAPTTCCRSGAAASGAGTTFSGCAMRLHANVVGSPASTTRAAWSQLVCCGPSLATRKVCQILYGVAGDSHSKSS